MKKVIVVDWLDAYGGTERIIRLIDQVFDFDACYTLVDVMSEKDREKIFNGKSIPIIQTPLKIFGKKFRIMFPLFDYFFGKLKVDSQVELIISISHAVAKGIKKSNSNQIHISFFTARNKKYIRNDHSTIYFGKFHFLLSPLFACLRRIDLKKKQNPDYIATLSFFVKDWITKTYQRDSDVIYPPVDLSNFRLETQKEEYYVTVGRLEPYKRFDIIVKAFNENGKKLIVVGNGSQQKRLKRIAKKNILFTDFLESEEVFAYISKAKAFIHAGIEDFGITFIEAQACGTPIIAYQAGGVLETVIQNKTGVFFEKPTAESLNEAIVNFEKITFDYIQIRNHALQFSEEKFKREFKEFVEEKNQKPQILYKYTVNDYS